MGMEHDTTAGKPSICKGEHSMRTWIKNGLRLTILMTALAGAGMLVRRRRAASQGEQA